MKINSAKLITRSVNVEGCSCCLQHHHHLFHRTISETIHSDCGCTCNVLFVHLSGQPGKINSLLSPRKFSHLLLLGEVCTNPSSLLLCHCFGRGAPAAAEGFFFLFVCDALDVEGTGNGVYKISEDPFEFSVL